MCPVRRQSAKNKCAVIAIQQKKIIWRRREVFAPAEDKSYEKFIGVV